MERVKSWFTSKTVWAGIVAITIAAYNEASTQFGLPPIPDFIYGILGAIGIYGRAVATERLGK